MSGIRKSVLPVAGLRTETDADRGSERNEFRDATWAESRWMPALARGEYWHKKPTARYPKTNP